MLKLRKVAVTGGLSCGKSSLCRILEDLGAYVVSADRIVQQLLSSDTNLIQEIVRLLGPSVLLNEKLDRSRIAARVFDDLEILKALEALVHPEVYKELEKDYRNQLRLSAPPPLYVAEIPLLFESGGEKKYDFTVAVVAEEEICCRRFTLATGLDPSEYRKRMARQLPPSEKAKLADAIIMNNGSLEDLRRATSALYYQLIN